MADRIRWGILGTGNIANKFAIGLSEIPDDAELVAVGSRKLQTAEAFAAKHGGPRAYGSYEQLVGDPGVDAVYVSTPHPFHEANSLLALEAGKHVLCEKPFALNAAQARRVVDAAADRGLFVMEAMWMRFLPAMEALRELVAAGGLGEPRMLYADFGFRAGWKPEGRLLNPALGGGGLLDVGVYPVSLASMLFGAPAAICSNAQIGSTGVDEQACIVLGYGGGQIAMLSCAIRTTSPHEATVMGADAWARLHTPWWQGRDITVHKGNDARTIACSTTGQGLRYEAMEVTRCLRAGRTSSEVMPPEETIQVMETLDAIRAQWGLRYPGEAGGAGAAEGD